MLLFSVLLGLLTVSMPVLEDTLMRVLVVGLSKEHHLSQADAIELAEQLVRRAASTQASEGMQDLYICKCMFIEICTYLILSDYQMWVM